MKILLITFFLLIFPIFIFGQQLNIKETLQYISETHTKYNKFRVHNDGLMEVKYNIDDKGFLIINFYLNNINTVTETIHIDDLKKSINFYNESSSSVITLECITQNCISYKGSKEFFKSDFTIYITQEYEARKIHTALKYLFSLLNHLDFQRDYDDPFTKTKSINKAVNEGKSDKVFLQEINGTFVIDLKFGGITKPFILDTGASETTISNVLEKELIYEGLITKNDYLPDGLYKIADGSIISQRRLLLKQLSVNQFIVKKLVVSVGNENSPLLLGKNFLDHFKSWTIDNNEKSIKFSL
jgi:predicted aspartyl protease